MGQHRYFISPRLEDGFLKSKKNKDEHGHISMFCKKVHFENPKGPFISSAWDDNGLPRMTGEDGFADSISLKQKVLEERKDLYITYLLEKVKEADWHGVSDVANDLRELEVEMRFTK